VIAFGVCLTSIASEDPHTHADKGMKTLTFAVWITERRARVTSERSVSLVETMGCTARFACWLGLACAVGCSAPPTQGKGGACYALTDCKPGLVCDEGRCTNDLSRLAGQTDDPPFTTLPVDAGAPEGGAMEAGTTPDGAPAEDASSMADGSPNASDASPKDASTTDGG